MTLFYLEYDSSHCWGNPLWDNCCLVLAIQTQWCILTIPKISMLDQCSPLSTANSPARWQLGQGQCVASDSYVVALWQKTANAAFRHHQFALLLRQLQEDIQHLFICCLDCISSVNNLRKLPETTNSQLWESTAFYDWHLTAAYTEFPIFFLD